MKQEDLDKVAPVRARLEKYLEGKAFHFNANAAALDAILLSLVKRREQYGEEYCPCRRVAGNKEEDAKIICPCIYHLKELEVDGHCHCYLFTRD